MQEAPVALGIQARKVRREDLGHKEIRGRDRRGHRETKAHPVVLGGPVLKVTQVRRGPLESREIKVRREIKVPKAIKVIKETKVCRGQEIKVPKAMLVPKGIKVIRGHREILEILEIKARREILE